MFFPLRDVIRRLTKYYCFKEAKSATTSGMIVFTVVGCDVIITAGELGVEELQLDVFEDEFGNG